MSESIFHRPGARALAITSCMTLGLGLHLGAAPAFHQAGQVFTPIELRQMGGYALRDGDCIVLKNGNKVIGELVAVPTIHYPFGDVTLELRDASLLSFISLDGELKLQVITRDGLNYVGSVSDAKILIRELIPSMSREPQYMERRIDPTAISFIAVHPRRQEAQTSIGRFYQLTLRSGDQLPIIFDREAIHLSDGWKDRIIRGNQFVEASFNGGLQGTIEDTDGLTDVGFAFVKEPQVNLTIPHCKHIVEMPWENMASFKLDKGEYQIAATDQSLAELYYPKPSRKAFTPENVAFDDKIPAYQETEVRAHTTPELLRQGPRKLIPERSEQDEDQMVLISGGQFYVAVDDDVAATAQHNLLPTLNKPSFVVEIPSFYVDKHEVTNAQYLTFIRATGHRAPMHWDHLQIPKGMEQAPVVNVSYYDAAAYAAWIGKRLPTELEWQRASEEVTTMVAGEAAKKQQSLADQAFSILSLIAGFETVMAGDEGVTSTFEFAVEDLGGRVAEWTSSSAVAERYSPLAHMAGMYHTDATTYGQHKIVRQGFVSEGSDYRSTHHQVNTSDKIGFRCVSDVL